MAWQQRGRGLYYTRSRRVDGKVKRTYVGSGPVAQLAAALDAGHRAQRLATTAAKQTLIARLKTVDELTSEFDECVAILTEATLLAAGYHQHDRGQWRRRHNHGRANQEQFGCDARDGGDQPLAGER